MQKDSKIDVKKELYNKIGPGDIIDLNDPETWSLLVKIAENLIVTDPVISNAVYKPARYPIIGFNIIPSDKLSDEEQQKLKKKVEDIIDTIRLREFLIKILIDYYTYGISIPTIELIGIKKLHCPNCNLEIDIDNIYQTVNMSYNNDLHLIEVEYKCPNCDNDKMLFIDKSYPYYIINIKKGKISENVYYPLPDGLVLRLWNVKDVEITYSKILDQSLIKIPQETIDKYISEILNFPLAYFKKIKYELLVSYFTKVDFYLDPRFYKTIKMILPSGIELPSLPPIARGYRLALVLLEVYKSIVNSAQAIDPFRIIYINPTGQVMNTPITNIDIKKKIMEDIERQIEKNPLKIAMVDFPLQEIQVGGNIQFAQLTQFLELMYNYLIQTTEMPKSLALEGTWASNVIGIRILENTLINIIKDIEEFLDLLSEHITNVYKLGEFTIRLLPFRRMDSMQELEVIAQILGLDNIPKEQLYNIFLGQSMEDTLKQIKHERELIAKYSMLSKLDMELKKMTVQRILQAIQQTGEITDEQIYQIAEQIVQQSNGNPKVIEEQLRAIAQEMGETVAIRVLNAVKEILGQSQKKEIKQNTEPMPEKQPSRRDDVR